MISLLASNERDSLEVDEIVHKPVIQSTLLAAKLFEYKDNLGQLCLIQKTCSKCISLHVLEFTFLELVGIE